VLTAIKNKGNKSLFSKKIDLNLKTILKL